MQEAEESIRTQPGPTAVSSSDAAQAAMDCGNPKSSTEDGERKKRESNRRDRLMSPAKSLKDRLLGKRRK